MPFDPDKYLADTADAFDPDAYLTKTTPVAVQEPLTDIQSTTIADPQDVAIPRIEPKRPMQFEAAPEKTFWQKAKGFFVSEPQYGRWTKPTRLDYLHKAIDLPASILTKLASGKTFGADKLVWYALSKIRPDLADRPLEEQMAELSPYEKSGFQSVAGEIAEFVGQIQTAQKILGAAGLRTRKGVKFVDKVIQKAPAWMSSGAIDALVEGVVREKGGKEIAKEVAMQSLIRGGEAIVWSGVEVGTGRLFRWAIKKFPRFATGWNKWAKGRSSDEIRPARQEVNEALRIYKETGDRTAWDAARIKYAGITPEGIERIQARTAPPVKDFGKFPITKAKPVPKVAIALPVKPSPEAPVAAPVAKLIPKGVKVPSKAAIERKRDIAKGKLFVEGNKLGALRASGASQIEIGKKETEVKALRKEFKIADKALEDLETKEPAEAVPEGKVLYRGERRGGDPFVPNIRTPEDVTEMAKGVFNKKITEIKAIIAEPKTSAMDRRNAELTLKHFERKNTELKEKARIIKTSGLVWLSGDIDIARKYTGETGVIQEYNLAKGKGLDWTSKKELFLEDFYDILKPIGITDRQTVENIMNNTSLDEGEGKAASLAELFRNKNVNIVVPAIRKAGYDYVHIDDRGDDNYIILNTKVIHTQQAQPPAEVKPKAGTIAYRKARIAEIEAKKAPKVVFATKQQKAQAHILKKEQDMSNEDFGDLAGKSMVEMTKAEADVFIGKLKKIKPTVKPVVEFTAPEKAEIMKSAKSKEVYDSVVAYANQLGKAPSEPKLRKSYIKDLRSVALTQKRLQKKVIDKELNPDQVNVVNQWSSARYALGQAEVKSGVPLRTKYSEIANNATKARLESDDIIRTALKKADVGIWSAAMTRKENNDIANWLFESKKEKRAEYRSKMSPKARKIGDEMHKILQGKAANEVREARWRLWEVIDTKAKAQIEKLERQIEGTKSQKDIENLEYDIASWKSQVNKVKPPAPAEDADLNAGRVAKKKGKLKEWIATQTWGTRQAYYMSEEALNNLVESASNLSVATTIEDTKSAFGKKTTFLREAQTRKGEARVKGGSVLNATTAHLERLMTFNATYDSVQEFWGSVELGELSKKDVRILQEFIDTAIGKRRKADSLVRVGQKATRLFWRFHFANPLKSAWFVTRNLLQNIAYAPSQMSLIEWAKSTLLVYGKKILRKPNEDMSDAFTKEWKPKISQKRQMYRQFMLQEEGDITGKYGHKATVALDYVGGLATMSDEINRISVWPVLYTSAQRNAKLYKSGKLSLGALSRRLRLDTLHISQRLELKQLLETNPKEFQARFAEYKTENIHFKYETAFRSAVEQQPGSRLLGGLMVYPRGWFELAYQNSVKPFYQGMRTKNYSMAWQGLVGLMLLYAGGDAARRLIEKITGRSAYGFFSNLLQYGPGGPGFGKIQDFFDGIQGIKYSWEKGGEDNLTKTVDQIARLGFRLGEPFVPIADMFLNMYENSNNVYGVRVWSLAKKKWMDEYGDTYGKDFRYTDRTTLEKIQHQIFGGAEQGEEE